MLDFDKKKPVLVTGGSGYLASWIIKLLLDENVSVHTTVRDFVNIDYLTEMKKSSGGNLKIFKANILDPDAFDEAMENCEVVIHTASPFLVGEISNPNDELVRPAKEGTINILETASRILTVKRVILTSSVSAIYGDAIEILSVPDFIFTGKEWNVTSNFSHYPYAYSKTLAEMEAWSFYKKQTQWDMVVMNPGWILGPSLSKRKDSTSIKIMIQLGNGTYKNGVPEIWYPIVDVRDAAYAHVKAVFTPSVAGRNILAATEARIIDIANILRNHFGDSYPFPRWQIPKPLIWLMAHKYGFTRKYVQRNVGYKIKVDNLSGSICMNMLYRPIEHTVIEHFQQILADQLI
ncbi:MAG: NAD-dependent epimerase/dehydratase family protein [Gammaproteobacteria bacterium]|nr:NAD-dependent epimerase/dehydratase family protein [Gammaproteobacteria bacterium]MBU1724854.1 NAD-dependent epimerase/dehydratase family protein [Gammaproteobacteria bacterium]MBU2005038.1 NAD-dependent epimerase/dehydratase family protein [Gammaproteobacteria bacterium]